MILSGTIWADSHEVVQVKQLHWREKYHNMELSSSCVGKLVHLVKTSFNIEVQVLKAKGFRV
jgi:hypothetical protein